METIINNTVVLKPEGNSRIKLVSDNIVLLSQVREVLSVKNQDKKYIAFADDREYMISPLYSFPEGLAFDVIATLKKFDPACKIDISKVINIMLPYRELKKIELIHPQNTSFIFRDYQEEGIEAMLKYGRGVIDYATGAGKSLVQYGFILNYWKRVRRKSKVLLMVPNIQLVSQMYKDFLEYGCTEEDISMFSSSCKKTSVYRDTPIIITNRDWILSRFGEVKKGRSSKKEETEKTIEKPPFTKKEIEVIIIDECHGLSEKNSVYSSFIRKFPTKSKFGFSGTVPEKENEETFKEYGAVIGTIGPVLKIKKAFELQEEGVLAGINIMSIIFTHTKRQPEPPRKIMAKKVDKNGNPILDAFGTPECTLVELDNLQRAKLRYPMEWDYLEKGQTTNETIAKLVVGLKGNSILLYDHNIHGDVLEEKIKRISEGMGISVFRIFGEVDVFEREDIRASIEKGNKCILVANTKCFSTGINIKNINNIIFGFTSGKAPAKIIQSIGRGLRKSLTKNMMLLIDISHDYDYSRKHYTERRKLYIENYNITPDMYKEKYIKIDDQDEMYDYDFVSTDFLQLNDKQ